MQMPLEGNPAVLVSKGVGKAGTKSQKHCVFENNYHICHYHLLISLETIPKTLGQKNPTFFAASIYSEPSISEYYTQRQA